MSDTKPTERPKIASAPKQEEEHPPSVESTLLAVLRVPRLLAFCDNETLTTTLRLTSKAVKHASDNEVVARCQDVLKNLPLQREFNGPFGRRETVFAHTTFEGCFASRESLAKAAVEASQPLYYCLRVKSDGVFDKEAAVQQLLDS